MRLLTDVLTLATLVGSGVVTGILLIFSNAVMPSLARHAQGADAMVTINERILNPTFLLLFMGTTLACAALAALTLLGHGAGGPFTLLGCALYIVGVFGVTAAFNVPMNDRLAATPAASPERTAYWATYLERWTRWNTVRSVLGVAGTTLLAAGVVAPTGTTSSHGPQRGARDAHPEAPAGGVEAPEVMRVRSDSNWSRLV